MGREEKEALCRFGWVTKEKRSSAKTLAEVQNCFTTKDTKSTKGSENKALDPALKLGDIEVHQESGLHSRQLHVGQQLRLVDALDLLDALQLGGCSSRSCLLHPPR